MTAQPGLRRFVTGESSRSAPAEPEPERCEMCDAPIDDRHGHVVDRGRHSLMCACRACYLLFTQDADARFRAIPDRYLTDPLHPFTAADWEALQVPVGAAFFVRGVGGDGISGFYPSPAGATECRLDLGAWERLGAAYPLLTAAEPEVEAVLFRHDADGVECYVVPVDVCYELVGGMRLTWRGFEGGAEANGLIDDFFTHVGMRAKPLATEP